MTGTYSLDYSKIGWPVAVTRPQGPDGKPDLADLLYHIHRCSHSHGVPVPDEFDFIPDIVANSKTTSFGIKKGAIRLSDRFIWALISIVVLDPINSGFADSDIDGYYIILGEKKLIINEWWGRLHDMPLLPPKTSNTILDFSKLE